ncbi:hypothetical protein EON65_53050 [archaeon]|nr:MAG: hypothetical protein EON65_53050 [archaeon]
MATDNDQQPLLGDVSEEILLHTWATKVLTYLEQIRETGNKDFGISMSLYKEAYDRSKNEQGATLYYYRILAIARQYLLTTSSRLRNQLPTILIRELTAADTSFQQLSFIGQYLRRYYVKDHAQYGLRLLEEELAEMLKHFKKGICMQRNWTMDQLEGLLQQAPITPAAPIIDEAGDSVHQRIPVPFATAGGDIEDLRDDLTAVNDTTENEEEHHGHRRKAFWPSTSNWLALVGLVYCVGLAVGTNVFESYSVVHLTPVILFCVSRGLWFYVIAANQLFLHGGNHKHLISAILAETQLQHSTWLLSVAALSLLSFGMAWISYGGSLVVLLFSLLFVLSFIGILVCPISNNVRFRQQLHWVMVVLHGVCFLPFLVWNWTTWQDVGKTLSPMSAVFFLIFIILNCFKPDCMSTLVKHRIWFEFVALELVDIVAFWSLEGVTL